MTRHQQHPCWRGAFLVPCRHRATWRMTNDSEEPPEPESWGGRQLPDPGPLLRECMLRPIAFGLGGGAGHGQCRSRLAGRAAAAATAPRSLCLCWSKPPPPTVRHWWYRKSSSSAAAPHSPFPAAAARSMALPPLVASS